MAGASTAYRYDQAIGAQPIPQRPARPRPTVRVIPGTYAAPSLSPQLRMVINLVVAAVVVLAVIGFVRVGLSSATIATVSQTQDLQDQIDSLKTNDASSSVSASTLGNPNNVKQYAQTQLDMTQPEETETVTLSPDTVQFDDSGNLSMAKSLSSAAQVQ